MLGEAETTHDKLRSILSQLEYTQLIRSWNENGVPFLTYMYVPEIHSVTNEEFHEREDEGHVFKVLYNTCTGMCIIRCIQTCIRVRLDSSEDQN